VIELSVAQQNTLSEILAWWNRKDRKQCFKLAGVAGSGKSTILAEIPKAVTTTKIAFVAFTGRAASVLKSKIKNFKGHIGTIHSLIYEPLYDKSKRFLGFTKKSSLEVDYIICDEGSMVSSQIYDDLVSYGIPILFCGDPVQLPPVEIDRNALDNSYRELSRALENCDIFLDEIHRQVAGNPIINMSSLIREGIMDFNYFRNHFRDCPEIVFSPFEDIAATQDFDFINFNNDIIITHSNRTRTFINNNVRSFLGYSKLLHEGERCICLVNNASKGIYNGNIGTITKIKDSSNAQVTELCANFSYPYQGHVLTSFIGQPYKGGQPFAVARAMGKKMNKSIDVFDYGYAVTTAKAQGSQWRDVHVAVPYYLMESPEKYNYQRWLYTSVTRAVERVFLYY